MERETLWFFKTPIYKWALFARIHERYISRPRSNNSGYRMSERQQRGKTVTNFDYKVVRTRRNNQLRSFVSNVVAISCYNLSSVVPYLKIIGLLVIIVWIVEVFNVIKMDWVYSIWEQKNGATTQHTVLFQQSHTDRIHNVLNKLSYIRFVFHFSFVWIHERPRVW